MRSFSISYQVNGKYTVFCGTCACPGKDYAVGPKAYGDTVYTKYFEIYGDGVLLFTSETMTRDSDPQYFEIDITGVTLLTIQYPATSGPNELATLCDGMLK